LSKTKKRKRRKKKNNAINGMNKAVERMRIARERKEIKK
jgi:hypothetical protein